MEGSEGSGVLVGVFWREALLDYAVSVNVTVTIISNVGLESRRCCLGVGGFVVGVGWCGVHGW